MSRHFFDEYNKNDKNDHWYPKDPEKRQEVIFQKCWCHSIMIQPKNWRKLSGGPVVRLVKVYALSAGESSGMAVVQKPSPSSNSILNLDIDTI